MKQVQISYTDRAALAEELSRAKSIPHSRALFHVYSNEWADDEIKAICGDIRTAFPDAVITGAAAWGTIVDGRLQPTGISVTGTFFEDPSTKVEALYYPLASGEAAEAARRIVAEVDARPWVRGVEALVMNNGESMVGFCEELSNLRDGVCVFGGLEHYGHADDAARFTVDGEGNVLRWGISAVLYGGDELHISTWHVSGWKPLGSEMTATRCSGPVLHELNGRPAHELYDRYLHIANDEMFFFNVLEFPFLFRTHGLEVLRTPIACFEDGSMLLAAPVPEGDKLRIAYGDPDEIMKAVRGRIGEVAAFRPDAVMMFPCGVRRTFWGDDRVDQETLPFSGIAPTSGHFVAGELVRDNGAVIELNSTLVVVAMREGELDAKEEVALEWPPDRRIKKSLVARFASFIDAAMGELEKTNADLEAANEALAVMSITDALTGLLNRGEIERRIVAGCQRAQKEGSLPFVLMMDLDDFKAVNDTFGHREGDAALRAFAELLSELVANASADVEFGRWGGEEFILFTTSDEPDKVVAFAESVRRGFETAPIGEGYAHTVSIGVTRALPGESSDAAIGRADNAMYAAKRAGKNQVVIQ